MATRGDIRQHELTVLVSGATGLIGSRLTEQLSKNGHSVHRLVRRTPQDATEHFWNPATGEIEAGIVDHVDVVVNLSGASIGRIPWTDGYKKTILDSRVNSTRTLVDAVVAADNPPAALVQASAVGFYGDQGSDPISEDSESGSGFLADVCVAWESETARVPQSTRVAIARTGLVIAKSGAMAPLRLQTLLGAAGPVGTGEQWWPWISLQDEVRALVHLVENPLAKGVYNLVAPHPAQSVAVTKELAHQMKRPHWLGLPTFAINVLMGEAGKELLLTSQKIFPTRLEQSGFEFDHSTLEQAIAQII